MYCVDWNDINSGTKKTYLDKDVILVGSPRDYPIIDSSYREVSKLIDKLQTRGPLRLGSLNRDISRAFTAIKKKKELGFYKNYSIIITIPRRLVLKNHNLKTISDLLIRGVNYNDELHFFILEFNINKYFFGRLKERDEEWSIEESDILNILLKKRESTIIPRALAEYIIMLYSVIEYDKIFDKPYPSFC